MNHFLNNIFVFALILILMCAHASIAQVNFTSSNLPVVIIDTKGQTIIDDIRIVADMGIIYNGEGQRNNVTDPHNNCAARVHRCSLKNNTPLKHRMIWATTGMYLYWICRRKMTGYFMRHIVTNH